MSKRAILGEVELSVVLSEDPIYANEITDKPVEKGQNVVDHVRNQPLGLTLEGVIAGKNAAEKIGKLRAYSKDRVLLKYVGRNIFDKLMIQELKTTHNADVRDGFKFTIRLREVRITEVQTALLTRATGAKKAPSKNSKKVSTQTKKVEKKGKKQATSKNTDQDRKQSTLHKLGTGAANYLNKAGGR